MRYTYDQSGNVLTDSGLGFVGQVFLQNAPPPPPPSATTVPGTREEPPPPPPYLQNRPLPPRPPSETSEEARQTAMQYAIAVGFMVRGIRINPRSMARALPVPSGLVSEGLVRAIDRGDPRDISIELKKLIDRRVSTIGARLAPTPPPRLP